MLFRVFIGLSVCLTLFAANAAPAAAQQSCSIEKSWAVSAWRINRPAIIDAQFDYTMPSRYSVGADGRVILPNTQDYVLNKKTQTNRTEEACMCAAGDQACLQDPARFQVSFDGSKTEWTAANYALKTQAALEEEFAGIGCENPTDRAQKTLQDAQSRKPQSFGRFNNAEFGWTVELGGASLDGARTSRIIRAEGQSPQLCLPEGNHRVSLRIEGTTGDAVKVLTRTVPIKDHLIVVIGDSYGAGEGVPEVAHLPTANWKRSDTGAPVVINDYFETAPFMFPKEPMPAASWAKTGHENMLSRRITSKKFDRITLQTIIDQLEDVSIEDVVTTVAGIDIEQSIPIPALKSMAQTYRAQSAKDPLKKAYFENLRSHRSSFTHASQLALELETLDPRSSVTFVNLAQSGATIRKGVLGPYRGIKYYYRDKANGEDWENFDYKNNMPHAACDLPGVDTPAQHMCPQMDELVHLIGNRQIDHLYMSVGGNDAGFSQAIAMLTVAWPGDTLRYDPSAGAATCTKQGTQFLNGTEVSMATCRVLLSVGDGKWPERVSGFLEGKGLAEPEYVAGLDDLYGDYKKVNDRLEKLRSTHRLGERVTLIAPPFFGTTTPEVARQNNLEEILPSGRNRNGQVVYCGVSFSSLPGEDLDGLHPREFRFAEFEIYEPMVEIMDTASADFGWRLLVQNKRDIATHGICGNDPYTGRPGTDPMKYKPVHPVRLSEATQDGIRWYRQPLEAAYLQAGAETSNTGLFHPNEYGYAYVKEQMKKADFVAGDVPNLRNHDKWDSFAEAQSLPDGSTEAALDFVSDKVKLYEVSLPSLKRLSISYVPLRGELKCPAITVYDKRGRVLETNSPVLRVLSQRSTVQAKTERVQPLGQIMADPCHTLDVSGLPNSLGTGARAFTGTINSSQVQRVVPGGRSAIGHSNVAFDANATKPVIYNSGFNAETVYIAVSDPENVMFDPLSGEGDIAPSQKSHIKGKLVVTVVDRANTTSALEAFQQTRTERIKTRVPNIIQLKPQPRHQIPLIKKEDD